MIKNLLFLFVILFLTYTASAQNSIGNFEIFNYATHGHLILSTDDASASDLSRIDIDFKIKNQNHLISRISSYYTDSSNGGNGGLKFFTKQSGQLIQRVEIAPTGEVIIPPNSPILIAGNQPFHGLRYSYKEFGNTFVDGPVLYGWSGGALGIKREVGEWIALKWNAGGDVAITNKLEAREIKVTESPTADFVFEEDYNLPTLQQVENHIKEKKHLPEIPSAKEMKKEGVNIGEFQIKLLQKIEELTLYIIEQNKENKILEKRITELEKIK
ncbi:hypothetical protein [Empedobacter sp. UBA5039]|uniref:hypothetical protein n=1 Tax=Empedobacter sp. UBA5039 TaxID=1946439 RepID=UPI0025BF223E|nr:hypothetical protein [Empedobacter sp. UBA5039]